MQLTRFFPALCLGLFFFNSIFCNNTTQKKIVGLIAIRNEQNAIEQCLKTLCLYTDAIIVLDDASTDNTLQIVKQLAQECNIANIITKEHWFRDEPGDRNKLLQAGRAIGGTHFICLDADEIFTSNFLHKQYLRKLILDLKPGDIMELNWIALWRSIENYRFDNSVWSNCYGRFIFCDDQQSSYVSDFIHTSRMPNNLQGKVKRINGYEYGVLHFQFVNWNNLLIKQAWYRCLEHIRNPQKSVQIINSLYGQSKNEQNLGLKSAPAYWFSNYPFFDKSVYTKAEVWHKQQILSWFKEYGRSFFSELDIWDINWDQQDN